MKKQINQFSNLVAVWKVSRNRVVIASSDLAKDLYDVFSREGWFQRAKLIQNAPESPQFDLGVVRLISQYFGSDVAAGSCDGLCLDVLFGFESHRKTEVADLDLVAVYEDIRWL